MKQQPLMLTPALTGRYTVYLLEQERSTATIQKYTHDINALCAYLDGGELTKAALIGWKNALSEHHAPTTVNSMLAAVNGFFALAGPWGAVPRRNCTYIFLLKSIREIVYNFDRRICGQCFLTRGYPLVMLVTQV